MAEVMANPDVSMFDRAAAAVAPIVSAWSNYETQKTERQKIDIVKQYQDQQSQLGVIDYDQKMRDLLGIGGGRDTRTQAQGNNNLVLIGAALVGVVGLVLLLK